MVINSFRDLRVWNIGMDVVELVYRVTRMFPDHEAYGLSSQMRRAAVSIPSNIAEGHTRQHRKEYLQHLSIAHASLAELDTQIEIACRLKHMSSEQTSEIHEHLGSLGKQPYALRKALQRSGAKN